MGDRDLSSTPIQSPNPAGVTWCFTSDAGLLAFRELDDALDLTIASDYLQESRTGRNIRHHLVPLLRHPSTAAWPATTTPTMQNVFPKTQP